MNTDKHREEHANTLLALFLRGMGISAEAETKGRASRKIPDIIIRLHRHTIVVEAEYENRAGAEADADMRLDIKTGINPDIICALSYTRPFGEDFLRAVEDDAPLHFAFKRAADGKGEWQHRWRTGTADDFAQMLRRPNTSVFMPHDEIAVVVAIISDALTEFAKQFHDAPARREKIAELLQASLPVAGKERESAVEQSLRLAGLIIFGAFLFQFALANKNKEVKNPRDFEEEEISDIENHWRFILENINYAAIFRVAVSLLKESGIDKTAALKLMKAARDTKYVARDGVDVMGVLYHRLLAEIAKPLGAYYTTIPAATMLSALALAPQKSDVQWERKKAVSDFRIADLACGSGTLLAAACGQVRDNVMRACARKVLRNGKVLRDDGEVLERTHRALLEEVVWGYDVLETAVHLTATTLGLMSPESDFRKSHIYCAAIGMRSSGAALTGSFQLLESQSVQKVLFDADVDEREKRIAHVETGEESSEPMPSLDLCLMNPPFVVGRKSALSYSFLQPVHAERVRAKMNALAKLHGFSNAGLGPGFVALGEKYIKPGGRMAFVMTATIANGRGAAWAGARRRIEKNCDLEYLIVSREPGRFNFSSSTNLQECMFVARKRKNGETAKERTMFCVLSENPRDGNMAHATVRAILDAEKDGAEWGKLRIDKREIGEYAFLPYREMTWDGIAFLNLRLTMAVRAFACGGKIAPYSNGESSIPARPMEEMAEFGSYRLHRYTDSPEIEEKTERHLAFSENRKGAPVKTSLAGYYPGHHKRKTGIGQKDIFRIAEDPNCYFLPMPKSEKWAKKYFSWGGRIVINTSFGFNSSRRLASLLSVPVQGANYQPVRLHNDSDARAKVMVLWLNSTPAVMMMAAYSVGCGGAKVMLSQKAIGEMPVLNLDALSAVQLKSLARAFDKIAGMDFLPIPQMAECPARKAADDAFARALNLDDFDFAALRNALAAEPIITGK